MGVLVLGGIQAIARVNLPIVNLMSGLHSTHPAPSLLLAQLPKQGNKQNRAWDWSQLLDAAVSAPALPPGSPSTALIRLAAAQTLDPGYLPQQESVFADPTNFGDRYTQDLYGKPVDNVPLIVLHETVGSADSAINTFQTPHPDENEQVSYHSIIRRSGTVVYIVAPEKRAFGAGDSAFQGANGLEAVKTNPRFAASVNNFAYHISLESPLDGANDAAAHSGYTEAQYQSLAWLVAKTGIPDDRIATHQGVDRTGSRFDPRSFDGQKFYQLLHNYPRSSATTSGR